VRLGDGVAWSGRVIAWVGAGLFWGVQLSLSILADVPLADSVFLALLFVAVPAMALAQLSMLRHAEVDRLPAYWGSIGTLWLLGTASWLVGSRIDGIAAIGLVALPPHELLGWSAGLTTACFLVILGFRELAKTVGASERPLLRQLLPKSRREKRVFALLCVAAGVGEETAYRGYSVPVLAGLMGLPGAVAVTSGVFGILHGYQGVLGMLRTAMMGGILAMGFVLSGSLWPAIVAHTLVDLIAGIVLGERLLPPVPARPGAEVLHSESSS